jgi:hypothetical protein
MIGLEGVSASARYYILITLVIVATMSTKAMSTTSMSTGFITGGVMAAEPASGSAGNSSMLKASTSKASRQGAIRSIPFEKLDEKARAKVQSVLANVSVYRRMPVRVVDCDPDLYLFLVRHPDVLVNIWEVMKLSKVKLRELDDKRFKVNETGGTLATVEFLYQSHDLHIVYAEGTYEGPLFARPVKGNCLMILRTGYVREPDGRYYITNRLDSFLNVQHFGAELLAKIFTPLTGNVADSNFSQTVAFAGSLSRTAEVNKRGVQRLASRLEHVQPAVRNRFAELAALVSRRSEEYSLKPRAKAPQVVSFSTSTENKRR